MLKKELEARLSQLGSMETNISWIKDGIENINEQFKILNGSVSKHKVEISNHKLRINNLEKDQDEEDEQQRKDSLFKKEHAYALASSIITAIVCMTISYCL